MTPAANPWNEIARLAALREAEVLDTAAEETFDSLVRAAATICHVPIALVSLIDADRQWFKASIGLDTRETPRDLAFCAHAILGDETFVVEDAHRDPRFSDNPLVTGDPRVRFYAGSPIITGDGQALGTVCVIDHQPRQLTAGQLEGLRGLAHTAGAYLDLRRTVRALADTNRALVEVRAAEAETQSSLAELLDLAHDLIQVTDLDGCARFTNRAWKEALGYSERELADLRPIDIVAPEHKAWVVAQREALGRGTNVALETFALIAADGHRVFVEGKGSPVFKAGKVIGFRSVLRDVTATREAQRAKREQVTAAANGLRGPLATLSGALSYLADSPLPPSERTVLDVARTATDRLQEQVQDLLDLQRLQAGDVPVQRELLSPASLLEAAMPRVARTVRERSLTLSSQAMTPQLVLADRRLIVQVIGGMLGHAARAASAGSQLTVAAGVVESGRVRFSFHSDDDSIPPEELRAIFDPPEQRPAGGTPPMGLALPIAGLIVKAHEGAIGASAADGRGNTLWFELPSR